MDHHIVNLEHDSSCLCIDCYAEKLCLPGVPAWKASDEVTNPAFKTICCPLIKLADCLIEDCDRNYLAEQRRFVQKEYLRWLQDINVDPASVEIVLRGQGGRNSRQRGDSSSSMEAPRIMKPMEQEYEIDLQVQGPPRVKVPRKRLYKD